jgi:hypothetical protein
MGAKTHLKRANTDTFPLAFITKCAKSHHKRVNTDIFPLAFITNLHKKLPLVGQQKRRGV